MVTEDNKVRYVHLMVAWRLSRGIKTQTDSLVLGLREMLPSEYLDQFDSQELEWVIAGTPDINMEDWKKHTVYLRGENSGRSGVNVGKQVVEGVKGEGGKSLMKMVAEDEGRKKEWPSYSMMIYFVL